MYDLYFLVLLVVKMSINNYTHLIELLVSELWYRDFRFLFHSFILSQKIWSSSFLKRGSTRSLRVTTETHTEWLWCTTSQASRHSKTWTGGSKKSSRTLPKKRKWFWWETSATVSHVWWRVVEGRRRQKIKKKRNSLPRVNFCHWHKVTISFPLMLLQEFLSTNQHNFLSFNFQTELRAKIKSEMLLQHSQSTGLTSFYPLTFFVDLWKYSKIKILKQLAHFLSHDSTFGVKSIWKEFFNFEKVCNKMKQNEKNKKKGGEGSPF